MSRTDDGRRPADDRPLPVDLLAVVAYAVVVGAGVLSGVLAGPVQVVLGAPLLLFLPGYALLATLFPGRGRGTAVTDAGRRGLGTFERVAAAVGASLALLPLLAVSLSLARFGLRPVPVVTSLVGLTVAGAVVGAVRRNRLPAEERFAPAVGPAVDAAREATVGADTGTDAALNAALAVAVLLAATGVVYGLAAPQRGDQYTEAALLTETNGSLTAGHYPESLTAGETATTTLTVENQEGARASYTVVVVIERVRGDGTAMRVVERRELTRRTLSVPDGRTARTTVSVAPRMLGSRLRLSYYLYRGQAPATASAKTATEHLYLWVDVREGNRTATPTSG